MVIRGIFGLLIMKKAYSSVDALQWSCAAAMRVLFLLLQSPPFKKKKRNPACAVNNKKKIYSKWLCCICDLCPFISLPAIKEFSLKSPTLCNCLRARTALKPGLNYKVLLTKLFQSQAWKKKKNHTLNWYRYASNTLCIDARIPLLVWLMSLKKVVGEKRLFLPIYVFPLAQLSQQSLCILDKWFPVFLQLSFAWENTQCLSFPCIQAFLPNWAFSSPLSPFCFSVCPVTLQPS